MAATPARLPARSRLVATRRAGPFFDRPRELLIMGATSSHAAQFRINWPGGYDPCYLPVWWFARSGTFEGHHLSGGDLCECLVTVRGKTAILDYCKFKQTNKKRGYEIGWTKLTFVDQRRTSIFDIEWRPESADDFDEDHEKVDWKPVSREHVSAIEGLAIERTVTVRLRDVGLKQAKLYRAGPRYICEMCKRSLRDLYGEFAKHAGEVHHKNELSRGQRLTRIEDLEFLCAACHAVLTHAPFKSKAQLREYRSKVLRLAKQQQ